MAGTTKDDEQRFWICGQCKTKIFHLKSEEPQSECPECGWKHGVRRKDDIPSKIKLDLTQY